jgi:hypothetical protein
VTQSDILLVVPDATGATSISPTDISQFIRLEQCERYLRLRLHERSQGQRFMREYGVVAQSIPSLLTRSGAVFEDRIEQTIEASYPAVNLATGVERTGNREHDNERIIALAAGLAPGNVLVAFQPRLDVVLDDWHVRGDVDIVRFERDADGILHILIADIKSSTSAKIEHRLQVAFYREMLGALLNTAHITHATIEIAILYRGTLGEMVGITPDDVQREQAQRDACERLFGTRDGLLEIVADPGSYQGSVYDLVTKDTSTAQRVIATPFENIPYHLAYKCDGCLYNEFCMKWSAETDDLSLLPHLNDRDKQVLRRAGVKTTRALATLKDLPPESQDLVAVPAQAPVARTLAATWPVGPRLDELIHRARRYRAFKKDVLTSLSYIPSKGYGSLPFSGPEHNPNLVRIYIDAQNDYLQDRIYLLSALVVGCENGEEVPERRRSIVHFAPEPPRTAQTEQDLFVGWISEIVQAVSEAAAPDANGKPSAPIHLIFWNSLEQRIILDGLQRHFAAIFAATPLYDFMTQIAAFDSPLVSFLDQDIRELKNYPMVCQSLQAVAAYLRFDWNTPEPYRDIFRERLFDFWGKLDQPQDAPELSPWYTNRARFGSQLPLEYAYAAWNDLDPPSVGKPDEFAAYRATTLDLIVGFQHRRLLALEHVAHDFRGNRQTLKTPFDLPDLAAFDSKARTLAQALDEFVIIERHTTLEGWKNTRLLSPERRVLLGETLIVRYVEDDQEPGVAAQNRENERRRLLKEQYRAEYLAEKPNAKKVVLPKHQKEASEWSQDGLVVRLRLEADCLDCDLDEALTLATLRAGDRIVLSPRTTFDSRLPAEERTPFTPTPKQLLYAQRAEIQAIVVERDESGRATNGYVEVALKDARGGTSKRGFTFSGRSEPLQPGMVYTLDSEPNDFYGLWCSKVVEGLLALEEGTEPGRNALYERLVDLGGASVAWSAEAAAAQARFLDGLDALHEAGALHDFEQSKRKYIGLYGDAPILLVQGPPGTGKSYGTAFAIFARMQGAMSAAQPFRCYVGCKTHAATDVLLQNIRTVQHTLNGLAVSHPTIFEQYFDRRLLDVPLFRVQGRSEQEGIIPLRRKDDLAPGEPHMFDVLANAPWCVVAATPGGVYRMSQERKRGLFEQWECDCLVLDEASQMNLPEAVMASLLLRPSGQLIVVGDHRQMPPIVQHDWRNENRRTFQAYRAYESLFLTLLPLNPPMIKFAESFRLHADMADFLRREVYAQDGIPYHSRRIDTLHCPASLDDADPFVRAVLAPEQTLVVVVHDEAASQVRNAFEQALVTPILQTLADPNCHGLNALEGLGVVVPHRAQRAALQDALPQLAVVDPDTGVVLRSAVDTVERFQGGERTAIMVSATESDRSYLLATGDFLLDPRRLTVALSRAKRKMVLVAARSVFELFSADEDTFANAQLWKNLLRRTCTTKLWEGERDGVHVEVWGNRLPL